MPTNITWTEPMEILLLKNIISSGVHLAPKGAASGNLWLQVNKDIFLNELFTPFKEEHYKEDEYRKLSDKLRLMKKEAKKMMESGNKSKMPGGELSEKFKLIKQIIDETDITENER